MELGPPPPADPFLQTLSPETIQRVQKVKEYFHERYDLSTRADGKDNSIVSDFAKTFSSRRKFSDYEVYSVLGRGAMGEVLLARESATGQFVALKKQSKESLRQLHQTTHVRRERNFLVRSRGAQDSEGSNCFVEFFSAFQDSNYVYLVMEYCPGGDLLHRILATPNRQLEPAHVAFYIAELVLAVEVLHQMQYVHRDLKPANMLLDASGHLKLTDFGVCHPFPGSKDPCEIETWLAKIVTSEVSPSRKNDATFNSLKSSLVREQRQEKLRRCPKLFEVSGTVAYMAPEVLRGQGYQFACDWWSVGCVMYECLYGVPPFGASRVKEIIRKILKWDEELSFYESSLDIPETAIDLMKMFLAEPEQRVGSSNIFSLDDVKAHPFFSMHGVSFETVRRSSAPWIPDVSSSFKISLAEEYTTTYETGDHPVISRKTSDLLFQGFTFEGEGSFADQMVTDQEGKSQDEEKEEEEDGNPWSSAPGLFVDDGEDSDKEEEEMPEEEGEMKDPHLLAKDDDADNPWLKSTAVFGSDNSSDEDGDFEPSSWRSGDGKDSEWDSESEDEGEWPDVVIRTPSSLDLEFEEKEGKDEEGLEEGNATVNPPISVEASSSDCHVDEDGVIWVDAEGAWWEFERPKQKGEPDGVAQG